jgi:MFS family permease
MFLIGVDDSRISWINTFFYIGEIMGCLSIARVPDVMGRKWPFLVSLIIQFPVYLGFFFSKNLNLTTALSFIMGFLHIGLYNGGYINVCEYVHLPWKNNVCTILLVFDMLTTIMIGVYFHSISRYWAYFPMIGLAFNLIAIFGIFMIPESPEYLYSNYKFP